MVERSPSSRGTSAAPNASEHPGQRALKDDEAEVEDETPDQEGAERDPYGEVAGEPADGEAEGDRPAGHRGQKIGRLEHIAVRARVADDEEEEAHQAKERQKGDEQARRIAAKRRTAQG